MTLDEAIEICEEKSKGRIINLKFSDIPMTKKHYQEHIKNCDMYLQLAEWLKELKAYRELVDSPKELEEILNNLMV